MITDNIVERRRYNLLKALQETDPQCQILQDEIAPIEEAYNWEWRDPLLPSLVIGQPLAVTGDPFTLSSLRDFAAEELVNRLVGSRGQHQPEEFVPALGSVQEAARRDFEWGNGIALELERREHWSEPVWKDIISGWSDSDLQLEQYREMLTWFSKNGVYRYHAGTIAESLHKLVRNGGKPFAPDLIDEAEQVALPLWEHLPCDERLPVQWWHEAAFSHHQIGYLARFWLDATAIRTQTSMGTTFSPDCIKGLEKIVGDGSLKGDIGAAVLTGQTHFLSWVHRSWTEETIQPMFTCGGNRERAAWGGLVEAQNITRQVAQVLGPIFQQKFSELTEHPANEFPAKRLFAKAYTELLCHYAPEPREWLKETIDRSTTHTAALIAEGIEGRLRGSDPEQQRDWWSRWMRQYWKDRNMGSPRRTSTAEGTYMVSWTPHLAEVFAEAVELAKATPWEGPTTDLFIQLQSSSAISRYPDLVADLLMDWREKSGVSIIWGDALEVLDKIEGAAPSPHTFEHISDMKAQIEAIIQTSQ